MENTNKTLRDFLNYSTQGQGFAQGAVPLNKNSCDVMFSTYLAVSGAIHSDVSTLAELYQQFIVLTAITDPIWENKAAALVGGNVQSFGRQGHSRAA
jgi:hypothetical protein